MRHTILWVKKKKSYLLHFTLTKNGQSGTRASARLAKDKEKDKDEKSFLQKASRHKLPVLD